ncbi:hypothetical protein GCM10010343_35820 [Streptomyces avidinii]|nr:hypothetical protein GCM10010343_35820 [Streptomyces avidinii]
MQDDIVHEEPEAGMRARIEGWRVGGLDLFDVRCSGFEVRRTARHVRGHRERPVVSVSLQTRGVHRAEQAGGRFVLGPEDICVFHELAPRAYGWSGYGASQAITMDMEYLGCRSTQCCGLPFSCGPAPCTTCSWGTCERSGGIRADWRRTPEPLPLRTPPPSSCGPS